LQFQQSCTLTTTLVIMRFPCFVQTTMPFVQNHPGDGSRLSTRQTAAAQEQVPDSAALLVQCIKRDF